MAEQYMGLGESAHARALEAKLDEKLRDRLRLLQAREAELIDESSDDGAPDRQLLVRTILKEVI